MAFSGALDVVNLQRKSVELQNSLDSAALAIGTVYYSGMTTAELEALRKDVFSANMLTAEGVPSEFEYEDAEVSPLTATAEADGPDNYITVASHLTLEPLVRWSFEWRSAKSSVVRVEPGRSACVLALNGSASSSVKIQVSKQMDMEGCVLAANSKSDSAVTLDGAANLKAECVLTSGRTSGLGVADLECPEVLEKQYPSVDPLAGVEPPSYTSCQSVPEGKTKTLSRGTYCDKTISGEVTLEAGVYILRGGRVNLGGNGFLRGAGVTIFLMDAEFTINGNEIVQLSPPETGPYAGITIYQPKSNTNGIDQRNVRFLRRRLPLRAGSPCLLHRQCRRDRRWRMPAHRRRYDRVQRQFPVWGKLRG
ncbi:pilus assembly protein [Mesorhizobium australicum]|nr:pilus assembly protein [Mesorhizobium australicum]